MDALVRRPEHPRQLAAVPLGGAARPLGSNEKRALGGFPPLLILRGRRLILEVLWDDRGPHALRQGGEDFNPASEFTNTRRDDLARVHVAGRFGVLSVHLDMTGLAGRGGL